MALDEDLRDIGDVTSEAIFGDETNIFRLFSKDTGILCGSEVFERSNGPR
jgi:nicotinate-nucleotide pyrophosphorylase